MEQEGRQKVLSQPLDPEPSESSRSKFGESP